MSFSAADFFGSMVQAFVDRALITDEQTEQLSTEELSVRLIEILDELRHKPTFKHVGEVSDRGDFTGDISGAPFDVYRKE